MAEVKWCRLISTRRFFSLGSRNEPRAFACILINNSSLTKRGKKDMASIFPKFKQQRRHTSNQNPPDSVHHSVVSVVQRLHGIEESMRVKGYSLLRWGLVAIVVMITTLYLFREEVRENVADEVAVVASKSLGRLKYFCYYERDSIERKLREKVRKKRQNEK